MVSIGFRGMNDFWHRFISDCTGKKLVISILNSLFEWDKID